MERSYYQLSFSIASFSCFFFMELTREKGAISITASDTTNHQGSPSLEICPDDIQPSGNAATIF
jgi:hypothetical protein